MPPRQIVVTLLLSCGIGIGCLFLVVGCGDESKTSGTQLQMSPEVKAELEDMRSTQKEERANRRQERAGRRGR